MDAEKRLRARLQELQGRLDGIEDTLEQPHSRDWDDQAIEREGEEVLEQIGLAGQREIAGIHAALERIKTGEYGFCVACGAEISAARLELLPATPFCKSCVN